MRNTLSRIETLAEENAGLSSKIRSGIAGFERRLQALNGKVSARVNAAKEDTGATIQLSFEPQGSTWKLMYHVKKAGDSSFTSQMLTNAEITAQYAATKLFQQLMDAMVDAHEKRCADLRPAVETIIDLGIQDVAMYDDDPTADAEAREAA